MRHRFFAASWKNPQPRTEQQFHNAWAECDTKLAQLRASLPDYLQGHVDRTVKALPDILQLPWVLTHADLSSSNLLFDQDTGHLTGVIDWADAALWPFGRSLWGLESVLGYGNDNGWHWLVDDQSSRRLFQSVFEAEIRGLSLQQLACIEYARVLGLLLRWGFVWKEGSMVPQDSADDEHHYLQNLSIFLGRTLLSNPGTDCTC
jgi:DNA excision repair protein ERCC-4